MSGIGRRKHGSPEMMIPSGTDGFGGGTSQNWISTPPAARGSSQRTIASNTGATSIAQLQLNEDVVPGEAIAATIQFGVNTPPNGSGSSINGAVNWNIYWGYGGVQFSKTVTSQNGRINVVGSWFRVDALIAGATAGTSTAVVSSSISPAVDGQTRWGTIFDLNSNNNAGKTFTILDRYVLSAVPCTLWRVMGYVYGGAGVEYVMLFDTNSLSGLAGSAPNGVCGAVPQNGTFSLDLSLSGRDYATGLVIACSSAGSGYVQDATALLAVDVELLNN